MAVKIGNQNLGDALDYISNNAVSGDNYYIVLDMNVVLAPKTLNYSNKTVGITLIADSAERIVQLLSYGSLFTIDSNVTLTLENNVTFMGTTSNSASLVIVKSSGVFTMNGGKICGNTAYSFSGFSSGGVYVNGGTFTMNGGEISGNTASSSSNSYGGGVTVVDGMFMMNNGIIRGNRANNGSGVFVAGSCTFTMDGGEISGNTASSSSNSYGGGVDVYSGLFSMTNGIISGNTAWRGGGVHLWTDGTFTKANTGGVIYDNNASGNGNAVYKYGSSSKKRNSAIPANEMFDSRFNVGWEYCIKIIHKDIKKR
jgi:hypothetical protein